MTRKRKRLNSIVEIGSGMLMMALRNIPTTQDSLGRSVVFSLSQPLRIEALLPSGRRPRAEDAKLRDRSAPDVCPIAILRGLLL
jgi:hypothetical protein